MKSYTCSIFSLWNVLRYFRLLYPSVLSARVWWLHWIRNLNLGVIIQSPWANVASISNHWHGIARGELWLWVLNTSATGLSLQCTSQSLEAHHYPGSFRNILSIMSHTTFFCPCVLLLLVLLKYFFPPSPKHWLPSFLWEISPVRLSPRKVEKEMALFMWL